MGQLHGIPARIFCEKRRLLLRSADLYERQDIAVVLVTAGHDVGSLPDKCPARVPVSFCRLQRVIRWGGIGNFHGDFFGRSRTEDADLPGPAAVPVPDHVFHALLYRTREFPDCSGRKFLCGHDLREIVRYPGDLFGLCRHENIEMVDPYPTLMTMSVMSSYCGALPLKVFTFARMASRISPAAQPAEEVMTARSRSSPYIAPCSLLASVIPSV